MFEICFENFERTCRKIKFEFEFKHDNQKNQTKSIKKQRVLTDKKDTLQ